MAKQLSINIEINVTGTIRSYGMMTEEKLKLHREQEKYFEARLAIVREEFEGVVEQFYKSKFPNANFDTDNPIV